MICAVVETRSSHRHPIFDYDSLSLEESRVALSDTRWEIISLKCDCPNQHRCHKCMFLQPRQHPGQH